jgi:hypothetical protein
VVDRFQMNKSFCSCAFSSSAGAGADGLGMMPTGWYYLPKAQVASFPECNWKFHSTASLHPQRLCFALRAKQAYADS